MGFLSGFSKVGFVENYGLSCLYLISRIRVDKDEDDEDEMLDDEHPKISDDDGVHDDLIKVLQIHSSLNKIH